MCQTHAAAAIGINRIAAKRGRKLNGNVCTRERRARLRRRGSNVESYALNAGVGTGSGHTAVVSQAVWALAFDVRFHRRLSRTMYFASYIRGRYGRGARTLSRSVGLARRNTCVVSLRSGVSLVSFCMYWGVIESGLYIDGCLVCLDAFIAARVHPCPVPQPLANRGRFVDWAQRAGS